MELARITVAGWAVATTVVGAASTGCGAGNKASSPSSSATPRVRRGFGRIRFRHTGPTNWITARLLIKASDISGDFTAPATARARIPMVRPVCQQLFANSDNSRRIGDTILIVADPATAAARTRQHQNQLRGQGQRRLAAGRRWLQWSNDFRHSPDNSKAVTVLLFTEGKALVNLEFDGAPNDPIDPDVATGYRPQAGRRDQEPVAEASSEESAPCLRSGSKSAIAGAASPRVVRPRDTPRVSLYDHRRASRNSDPGVDNRRLLSRLAADAFSRDLAVRYSLALVVSGHGPDKWCDLRRI